MNGSVVNGLKDILREYQKQVDLSPFISNKNFNEIYYTEKSKTHNNYDLETVTDITFYQASYYLRFGDYDRKRYLVVLEAGREEDFKEYVKQVNNDVTELYEEYIANHVDARDRDTFRYFHRVTDDLGICHMSVYSRNGYLELKKELEELEKNDFDDDSCSRCRGGGCPSCEPSRFI